MQNFTAPFSHMKKTMKILGIDPSLTCTGFAVLEKQRDNSFSYVNSGVFKPPSSLEIYDKIELIVDFLRSQIHAHSPEKIIIEQPFTHKNPATTLKLGMLLGAIVYLSRSLKIAIFPIPPSEVKKQISSSGRATKSTIESTVRMILPELQNHAFKSDDESDAVAIALCSNCF